VRAHWLGLIAAGLIAAGCGSDDETDTTAGEGSQQPAVHADVGEAPSRPVDPVEGVTAKPPDPVVVVAGETQRGDGFELVLYGSSEGPCLGLVYPQRGAGGGSGGGGCGEGLLDVARGAISGSGSGRSGEEYYVQGFTNADVESVVVSLPDGSELDADIGAIPARALRQAGGRPGTKMFVAYLPVGQSPGGVRAEAFDASGMSLGTTAWSDFG
jgi:hypothetical protein